LSVRFVECVDSSILSNRFSSLLGVIEKKP
jgi:hypothetical protein